MTDQGEYRILVIHPVINEKENLEELLPEVLKNDVDVLIVDDASTDGTPEWIKAHAEFGSRIHIIEREKKLGLGTAYVAAFRWALEHGYDVVAQMDADGSHRPEDLPVVLKPILEGEADLVIGSRYIDGLRVLNWPLRRLFLSVAAMKYSQLCLGWKLQDATGGFKAIHRRVFELLDLDHIRANGYVFQAEVNYRVYKAKLRIKEVPIVFVERRIGVSKMNYKIIFEALMRIAMMRFSRTRLKKKEEVESAESTSEKTVGKVAEESAS